MIRRIADWFGRQRTSISFRLTLSYGLLATLTTLALVVFIYFRFMDALYTQHYRQIEQSGQRLVVVFEEGNRADLIRSIELTLSDRIDSEREFYLLLDEHGTRLAGNLDSLPEVWNSSGDKLKGGIVQEAAHGLGHFKKIALPDGSILIVGHDTSEIDDIASLITRSILVAVAFALMLIAVGAYIFRSELEYRVGKIRRATEKIGAGHLSQRIPLSGVEDEFTHLHHDFNAMLDRIEALMKGVRYVSDTIAHNLRTPLMRVLGRLREAQQPGHTPTEVLELIQYATEEIENLNILFGKLLHIAEMEAGVRRQAFRPCRLDIIARDVAEMYDAYADDRGLRLTVSAAEKVIVQADPDLIASAIANVVDNAIKYAATAVRIRVEESRAGEACITIEDDGPGVAQEEFARIGRHFYRLNSSYQGHGLGLSNVRAIVRLHHGRLVFSDAGPGLRATLCLPPSHYP